MNAAIRRKQAEWRRVKAVLGAASLEKELSESAVSKFQLEQGQWKEQSDALETELTALKQQRKQLPHHVAVKDLPEESAFTRLRSERKFFLDTIKMIAYRAETSMVSIVREKLVRTDDGRALLQQIFQTAIDLIPNPQEKTLTVRLHHLTQRAHDDVIRHLCDELNATQSEFPGTDYKLIYTLGSS